MRSQVLIAIGIAGFLTVAACHKAVPVAAKPTPPAPVAEAAPAKPAPAPVRAAEPARVAASQPAPAPRPTTMTKEERVTLDERLAHLSDALFDYDKYTIRADASTALRDDVNVIRGILDNYPNQKLLIEGHADERGSAEYNLALGDKRAMAAEEFLTTMGVAANQLSVISYGKEHPLCKESNEGCWQKNRRVHIAAAR